MDDRVPTRVPAFDDVLRHMEELSNDGCFGKQAFKSKRLAEQVAGRSRRRKSCDVHVFKCSACRRWHIGTPKPRAPK